MKKIILSEKQQRYLVAHFKHTTNRELCDRLGLKQRTLIKWARALGLQKSRQYLRTMRQESIKAAIAANAINGFPPPGYQIPGRERHCFRKGESNLQRFGKRIEAERRRRSAEGIRAMIRRERARIAFGLEQATRRRLVHQSPRKIELRCYLKRRGYTIDEEQGIAFWDESTQRCPRLEKIGNEWFRYAEKGKGSEE